MKNEGSAQSRPEFFYNDIVKHRKCFFIDYHDDIFYCLQDYLRNSELVCDVFKKHGIGLVTLQPEFTLTSISGKHLQLSVLIIILIIL